MLEDSIRRLNRSLLAEPSQIEKARELAALCARRPEGVQGTILEAWRQDLAVTEWDGKLLALRRLLRLGPMAAFALPELHRLRRHAYRPLRRAAVDGLYGLGAEALPYFLEALDSEDRELRLLALDRLIATRQAGRHSERLLSLLDDRDARVRGEVIRGLRQGGLQEKKVQDALKRRSLDDEDPSIRRSAIAALGTASPEIAPFLKQIFTRAEDCGDRSEAAFALRRFPQEAASIAAALVTALAPCPCRDRRCSLNRGAELCLAYIGPAAVPLLLKAVEAPEPSTRAAALRLLAQHADDDALLGRVAACLRSDPSDRVRREALEALDSRPAHATAPLKLLACCDEDFQVRSRAWAALLGDHGIAEDAPAPEGCDPEVFEALRERFYELCEQGGDELYRSFLREGFVLCCGCRRWNSANPTLAWWQGACWHCQRPMTICLDDPSPRREEPEIAEDEGEPRRRARKKRRQRDRFKDGGRRMAIHQALLHWGRRESERLRRSGPRAWFAIPILIQSLRDPERRLGACRALANEALAGSDRRSAIPELMLIIESGERKERQAAVTALGAIGAPALPELMSVLGNEDRQLRRMAAWSLGEIGAEAREAAARIRRAFDPWWDRAFLEEVLGKLALRDMET